MCNLGTKSCEIHHATDGRVKEPSSDEDRQEWMVTPVYSKHPNHTNVIIACVLDIGVSEHRFNDDGGSVYAALKASTDAHNAALDAERDENWRHAYDNLLIDYHERQKQLAAMKEECADVMDKHEQQMSAALAAEREKRKLHFTKIDDNEMEKLWHSGEATCGEAWRLVAKGKEEAYIKMEQQLLQTQAEISEHNKSNAVKRGALLPIIVDLSALDKHDAEIRDQERIKYIEQLRRYEQQHDAEVRKPLVDALEELKDFFVPDDQGTDIINDALAKVKEGK